MSSKKIIICAVFIKLATQLNAQIITTIAGIGTAGYSGDNGQATSAKVDNPVDVTTDKFGNIYFSDSNNHRIRKINTSGIVTTIAGSVSGFSGDGGTATAAKLSSPASITTDSLGNIYFIDLGNQRIRKINTSGIITTIAGNGSIGNTGDGGPAIIASLDTPSGITVDYLGNVYFTDRQAHSVRKVSSTGIITTLAGNGNPGNSGDGGTSVNAQLNYPSGIAVSSNGIVYISDTYNNKIRKIDSAGVISTIAGNIFGTPGTSGDGGPAHVALFDNPIDLAFDPAGNLYTLENGNRRVRIIEKQTGNINTVAGNGQFGFSGDGGVATYANIASSGIAIDKNFNLYLSEIYVSRIRKVSPYPISVKELEFGNRYVKLYPNPASDKLIITSAENEKAEFQIFDQNGIQMLTSDFVGQKTIDATNLSAGVYSVLIKTMDMIINKKLIIIK